jgi:hypothetical protein
MVTLSDLTQPDPTTEGSMEFCRRNEAIMVKDAPLMQWLREQETGVSRPVIDAVRRKEELGEVWTWLVEKNIITTKAGRLGLSMKKAREGDQVAILQGCKVPLLLRTSSIGLRLVGACYIDGLMDGEAMRSLDNGRRLGMLHIN